MQPNIHCLPEPRTTSAPSRGRSVRTRRAAATRLFAVLACAGIVAGCAAAQQAGPAKGHAAIAQRYWAQQERAIFHCVAARLATGIDTARAWRYLDTLLSRPSGDMFWQYPAAATYFYCRDKLSAQWRSRFRSAMRNYSPYRGDTENHFLMYYVTLLLFSQEWPTMQADEWFNGKSSAENYAEARGFIDHWIDDAARYGITEWDSPRYLYFYLTPLLVLRDGTTDTTLRRRTDMIIDALLADYATEYLNGSYCGAHSRDHDAGVINPRSGDVAAYSQFYFEDTLTNVGPDLAFASFSGYRCPPIIRAIAHDRSQAYVHLERKRSRAKIRFSAERYTPVERYTYMHPDYGIGSIPGGIQQPIQQHSWDVTFASTRPNNTIFGLHPNYSDLEMGMFFPEEPELIVQNVVNTKGSYVSENKWLGGSRFERLYQHENALVALYAIPPGESFQHIDMFFPKTLDTVERTPGGWIFARMEDGYVAVFPLNTAYEWIAETANWRLRMPARTGMPDGYVVECGSRRDMSYAEFKQRRMASAPVILGSSAPSGAALVTLRTVNGTTIRVAGSDPLEATLYVDGSTRPANTEWLYNGPHLNSRLGSGVIAIRCNGAERVLDFTRSEVVEQ